MSALRLSFAFAVVALGVAMASGQEEDFEKRVNRAIEQGVHLLKQQQSKEGSWETTQRVGLTSLCAWTLLEGGVPKTDPAVEKAAAFVRRYCLDPGESYANYAVSTSLFFLDKLGDPKDVPLIEALSAQLIAGQNRHGGWDYSSPKLSQADQDAIRERVKKVAESTAEKSVDGATKTERKPDPESVKLVAKLRGAAVGLDALGDTSNTQFAMMGVWVAKRYGMPVTETLLAVQERFRRSQQAAGTWGYLYSADSPRYDGGSFRGTPTLTCAGVLAQALGHGVKKKPNIKELMGEPTVKAGMAAVNKYLDDFSRQKDNFFSDGKNYCFLWSLERMAVVYDLKKVGTRDWYRWGADKLLDQLDKGSGWSGAYGTADVCFAVLFLKRANVAEDLTRQLNLFNPIIKVPPPKR
jgi:hypothetical protein